MLIEELDLFFFFFEKRQLQGQNLQLVFQPLNLIKGRRHLCLFAVDIALAGKCNPERK